MHQFNHKGTLEKRILVSALDINLKRKLGKIFPDAYQMESSLLKT